MQILFNGKQTTTESGMTLGRLLDNLNYNRLRIAVQINEQIIPKEEYDTQMLEENDVVEVVSFMGGG